MGDNWRRREREKRMSHTEGNRISVQNACRRCAQDGHYARDCRAPKILFCWICGRPGIRTIACCRLPRRRLSRARRRERSRSSSSTDTNRIKYTLNRIFANIIVGGEEVAATIDTGATASFVRDSFVRKLGSKATRVSYNSDVQLADGSIILLDYAIETQVEFGNCSGTFKFVIMPGGQEDIVLGLDFLTKSGTKITMGGDSITLREYSPEFFEDVEIDIEATSSQQTTEDEYEPREHVNRSAGLDLSYLDSPDACEEVEIDVEGTPSPRITEDEPRERLDRLAGLDLSHLGSPGGCEEVQIDVKPTISPQTTEYEPRKDLDHLAALDFGHLNSPGACEKVQIDVTATISPQTNKPKPPVDVDRLAGVDLSHLDSETIVELREVVNALDLKGRFSVIRNVKEQKFRILVRRNRVIAVTLRSPTQGDSPGGCEEAPIDVKPTVSSQTTEAEPRKDLDRLVGLDFSHPDSPGACEKVQIDGKATISPQRIKPETPESIDRLAGVDLSHLDSATIVELREVVNALDLKGRFSVIRNIKEQKFRILVSRAKVIAVTLRNPTSVKD